MLTTGGVPEYDDYHFKNSPESSTDSFMTGIFETYSVLNKLNVITM